MEGQGKQTDRNSPCTTLWYVLKKKKKIFIFGKNCSFASHHISCVSATYHVGDVQSQPNPKKPHNKIQDQPRSCKKETEREEKRQTPKKLRLPGRHTKRTEKGTAPQPRVPRPKRSRTTNPAEE